MAFTEHGNEQLRPGDITYLLIIKDVGELVLSIAGTYAAIYWLVKRQQDPAEPIKQRTLLLLWITILAVLLLKLIEDVITLESRLVDKAVLFWIHASVPNAFTGFFQAVTISASAKVIFPLLAIGVAALMAKRRRFEAAVISGSVLANVLLVYCVKSLVARERPMLWETQGYWGSSFPSGHTLTSATFATALCICIARRWPVAKWPSFMVATVWVFLVALSRLVLGVHWPTDVLAALCAGVLIALAVDASFYRLRQRWQKRVSKPA